MSLPFNSTEHSRDQAKPNPSQLPSTSTPQHADYGGMSTGEYTLQCSQDLHI